MLFTGLLVPPPPQPHPQTYSVFVFVCGHVFEIPLYTLLGREECVFVCVIDVFLSAWTWIFSVHCDLQCCGFDFPFYLVDRLRNGSTKGLFNFITVETNLIRLVDYSMSRVIEDSEYYHIVKNLMIYYL